MKRRKTRETLIAHAEVFNYTWKKRTSPRGRVFHVLSCSSFLNTSNNLSFLKREYLSYLDKG